MDVLIIDDDPTSVFLAKLLISRSGLFDRITSYQNPVDALSFVQVQLVEGQLPQVILLDINMPLIDGWQLLDALIPYQAQIQSKHWIYMLTSSTSAADISRAKEHPLVTDIIFKPLVTDKVHEIYEHVR